MKSASSQFKEKHPGDWAILESRGVPDNLQLGGSLYLRGTQIKELPDNLQLGGSLYLEGTQIKELPDNLQVGGSLYLRGTQIKELPDNLQVGGSLDLRGTQIKELPDNLQVGGSLYLRGTQIKELPDNLQLGGSLYLEGTAIASNFPTGGQYERPLIPWHKKDVGLVMSLGCITGTKEQCTSAIIKKYGNGSEYEKAVIIEFEKAEKKRHEISI